MSIRTKITFEYLCYGQVIQNVVHFNLINAAWDTAMISAGIYTHWAPNIRPLFREQITWLRIRMKNEDDPLLAAAVEELPLRGTGGSDDRGASFISMVWKLETALAGRAYRGRIFMPMMSQDALHNGLWSIDYVNNVVQPKINDIKLKFFGDNPTSNLQLCVHQGGGTNTHTPVTNIVPRLIAGVQRRRNIGVGI